MVTIDLFDIDDSVIEKLGKVYEIRRHELEPGRGFNAITIPVSIDSTMVLYSQTFEEKCFDVVSPQWRVITITIMRPFKDAFDALSEAFGKRVVTLDDHSLFEKVSIDHGTYNISILGETKRGVEVGLEQTQVFI